MRRQSKASITDYEQLFPLIWLDGLFLTELFNPKFNVKYLAVFDIGIYVTILSHNLVPPPLRKVQ